MLVTITIIFNDNYWFFFCVFSISIHY